MKRKAALTAVVLVIVLLCSSLAYAADLSIVGIIPNDGESGKQITNMAVKIQFSEKVTNTANDAANAKLIKIKDSEGNSIDFEIIHHSKYENELWLIIKSDLTSNTVYTVNVQPGIVADNGTKTTAAFESGFKTRNTKSDGTISIILTVGMMAIMILSTRKTMQSQQNAQNAEKGGKALNTGAIEANPYKLAKERGISVDEAKAIIDKEKAKNAKKAKSSERAIEKAKEKAAEREAAIEKRVQEIHDASVYKVKCAGSVRAHGGKIPKVVQKRIDAYKKHPKR